MVTQKIYSYCLVIHQNRTRFSTVKTSLPNHLAIKYAQLNDIRTLSLQNFESNKVFKKQSYIIKALYEALIM